MTDPTYVLLYVDSPKASEEFYRALFAREPVESSPTFALFVFDSGLKVGLWSRHTVEPAASAGGGGAELCFRLDDAAAVDAAFADWKNRGIPILQEATDMDFGHTFVALDPDGHRLRVFALAPE